jgi:hypothetical protein
MAVMPPLPDADAIVRLVGALLLKPTSEPVGSAPAR